MRNRAPILIGLLLLVLAMFASGIFSKPAPTTVSKIVAATEAFSPRTLKGFVKVPLENSNIRVTALLNNTEIAGSKIIQNAYSLELPARLNTSLGYMTDIQALHGPAKLQGTGNASEIIITLFEDSNNNQKFDVGEIQYKPALLPTDKEQSMVGYFQYKVLVLNAPATLLGKDNSATGAKDFYRYDANFSRGYNIMESELASNGYDNRASSNNNWDLLLAPAKPGSGGKAGPAQFKP